jgi:hypothetical protein
MTKTMTEMEKQLLSALESLQAKLRATAAGVAGQLQQFAAHVRDYLTGADAQRPGVSALEQSGDSLRGRSRA